MHTLCSKTLSLRRLNTEMENKKTHKKIIRLEFIFLLFIFSCGSESETQLESIPEQMYDNEILNPRISIHQEENIVIHSTSNKLFKDEGEDAILVGEVVSEFFDDEGVHISTLYSDSAIVENVSNNLRAYGNVRVISDSGYTLISEEIMWDNQYKLITSQVSVTFTDKSNTTVKGVGFESDMDLTNYKIFKFIGSFEDSE
jgi:LPS export ABC transporter protein LptC